MKLLKSFMNYTGLIWGNKIVEVNFDLTITLIWRYGWFWICFNKPSTEGVNFESVESAELIGGAYSISKLLDNLVSCLLGPRLSRFYLMLNKTTLYLSWPLLSLCGLCLVTYCANKVWKQHFVFNDSPGGELELQSQYGTFIGYWYVRNTRAKWICGFLCQSGHDI